MSQACATFCIQVPMLESERAKPEQAKVAIGQGRRHATPGLKNKREQDELILAARSAQSARSGRCGLVRLVSR